MMCVWLVFSPLEVGTIELEGERRGGDGGEREMELKHVSSLAILGWYVVLVKDGSCRGTACLYRYSNFKYSLVSISI